VTGPAAYRPATGAVTACVPRTFCYVVGTRPNFMKMAPVLRAMRLRLPADRHVLIHTGQHYDHEMSRVFFEDLDLPEPDHHLNVGSGDPSTQTAQIMERVGALFIDQRPALVTVAGDVNSTLAGALSATKLGLRLAHVEAGLRSFDPSMPEELNRTLVDRVSDLLLIHSPEARDNLLAEGIAPESIHMVGNTMIDTLLEHRSTAQDEPVRDRYGLRGRYLLVTLHRPALLQGPLEPTIRALDAIAAEIEVVFPAHPRTRAAIERLSSPPRRIRMLPPLGYLEFLALQMKAAAVVTDSGGVQEETTVLGVPCFTLRANTERPVTLTHGSNTLLGLDPERILDIPERIANGPVRVVTRPEGWDGGAGERSAEVLDARTPAHRGR
jgi:UDP-N-acetylglucosamine 2-epimerase (non-hydrolysing)